MVHEERRIRNALQTQHEMKEFSFETEEYLYAFKLGGEKGYEHFVTRRL